MMIRSTLVETELVAPAIVELRRARRRVVRHRRGLFQRAAVLEIRRDPGRPETVVAEPGCDAGRGGAPTDHRIGVRLRQHRAGELAGAAADRAEQRPLGIAAQCGAAEIGGETVPAVAIGMGMGSRYRLALLSLGKRDRSATSAG